MILDLLIIIFIQPLVSSLFFFLAPILHYFFKDKIKQFLISLFLFTFLADFIFIKPFGFFLLLISSSLLIILLLEKIFGYYYFYQKLIHLIIFNSLFLSLFFYLSFQQFFSFSFFLKFLVINLFYQIIYLVIKELLGQ